MLRRETRTTGGEARGLAPLSAVTNGLVRLERLHSGTDATRQGNGGQGEAVGGEPVKVVVGGDGG